jgi:uncharacterized repeat protein (TIGR01451 family)
MGEWTHEVIFDNNTVSENTTVVAPTDADVAVTKTGPRQVEPGASFSYNITVTNNGPAAATSVNVTDALPAALTFVSANTTQGSWQETSGNVTWNLGTIEKGLSANLTLTVIAPSSAMSVNNTATVVYVNNDFDPTNNSSTATVLVQTTNVLADS